MVVITILAKDIVAYAAVTDIRECTQFPVAYSHENVLLWDMPGYGTVKIPAQEYAEKVIYLIKKE